MAFQLPVHAIAAPGLSGGRVGRDHRLGALQQSTLAWTAATLDEAWVIISEEDAKAASLDIGALRQDIDALRGTGGG